MDDKPLVLDGKTYRSRLLIGSGRYRSAAEHAACVEAAGVELVTVAVRRVQLAQDLPPDLGSPQSGHKVQLLPNSAGCTTAEEAVRCLRLAREAGGERLVKLEVIGDEATLLPNMPETLKAAQMLCAEDFAVMAYCTDDLVMGLQLQEMGCAAVMPLAAPIGSGLGLENPSALQRLAARLTVPVLVDAGLGSPSDAAAAMEFGCDGVLLNTAIAQARDSVAMARAMRLAVEAGRLAFLAGRMAKREGAAPSSPVSGRIGT